MFGTIRKHQTWLWAIIITLTIISFVIFFSPASKLNGSSRGPVNLGSINGERISELEYVNTLNEVKLRYFFMSGGHWPDEAAKRSGFDLERETYQWLLLLRKQNQFDIHISSETVAQFARDMLSQFQREGISSADAFQKIVLDRNGLSMDDFERFVRHYLGIQQLISLVGLSGELVTPQEAKSLYVREHEELSTAALFFSASNYLANVTVLPDAVTQFYSNRLSVYRIPERVTVNYVEFGVSNRLAAAEAELSKTNFSEIVDANLQRMGTNFTRFGKTPAEAKVKIREEIIKSKALAEARKEANEFATQLFDLQPSRPENLQSFAKTKGLAFKTTAPFDRNNGPQDLEVGPEFATKAFLLSSTNEPFAGPLIGQDAVYVIGVDKWFAAEIPPLDKIREKVVADYRHEQARTLARQSGATFYPVLTNGLAQGKTFEALCSEAKLTPVNLPPFSISTRTLPEERVSLNELKQLAFSTTPGKASNYQPTPEGGLIVYVKAKLPLDEAKMNTDLASFVNYLRQQRQNEAFNDWFRKEAERGLREIPALQQQRPPPAFNARKS